jgi:hypothetical protein
MNKVAKWFKKYFIPHEHNNHHPHFLRHESMLFMFLLIIIVEVGFLAQVFLVFDKTKFLAAVLPGVLTQLTNQEREAYDAPELKVNELLTRAAEMKAQDMAEKGYFAHTSPEGRTPWYWLGQVGYKYSTAGENLAVNFYDSEDVDQAWMNSPTHKANIIKKEYTEIGIGVARGTYQGQSTIFVAQFFGKPYAEPIAVAPISTEITKTEGESKIAEVKPKPVTPKPVAPKVTPKVVPTETPTTPIQAPTSLASNNQVGENTVLGEETVFVASSKNLASSIKSFLQRASTSPSQTVAIVYGSVGLLLMIALLLVQFIRSEITHPRVMIRGLALMAVIVVLLYINVKVLSIETLVPLNEANTANVSFIAL